MTIRHLFTTLAALLFTLTMGTAAAGLEGNETPREPIDIRVSGKVVEVIASSDNDLFRDYKICVVYVQAPKQLMGIVEDIYFCDLSRALVSFEGVQINVTLEKVRPLREYEPELYSILKKYEPRAEYFLWELE